jgi:hypothetical protein
VEAGNAGAGKESGGLRIYPTTRKGGAWWGPRPEQLSALPDGEAGCGRDRIAMDGPGAGTSGLAAASQNQENYPTLAPRTALEWGTRVQLSKLGRATRRVVGITNQWIILASSVAGATPAGNAAGRLLVVSNGYPSQPNCRPYRHPCQ